jgi:ribosomal protein L37E
MVPKSLTRATPARPQPTTCRHRSVEQSLTSAGLFAETEGFLTAIQDQVILTRNYKKYILKQPNTDELCRRCGKESEKIQHITAACEQLASTEYLKRHDGIAKMIHQKLAEADELTENKSPYYKYTPANVLENDNFKLYWNRSHRVTTQLQLTNISYHNHR